MTAITHARGATAALIALIVAVVLAGAAHAAELAQTPSPTATFDHSWRAAVEPEYELFGYANPHTAEIWMAGRVPMQSATSARELVAVTNAADIERNLDMVILAEDRVTDLAPLGIGPVSMYGGIMGGDDAVVLLTSYDTDVWLFVFLMPDISTLDADAVVAWSVTTMQRGAADAPGAGFIAIDAGQVPAWSPKDA